MATRGYTAEAEVRDVHKYGYGCKTFKPVWSMFGEKDVYGVGDFIAHFPFRDPIHPGVHRYVQVKNVSRGSTSGGTETFMPKLREFASLYLNEKEEVQLWVKRAEMVSIPEIHYDVVTITRDPETGELAENKTVISLKEVKHLIGEKVNARRKSTVENPPRGAVPLLSVSG